MICIVSEESDASSRQIFDFPTEYPADLVPPHGPDLLPPMDLGEFMAGQDLDLLGRLFGQPQSEK